MLRLLRWLFTGDGHLHEWEQIGTTDVRVAGQELPQSIIVTLQCKKCGNIKTTKIKN